jgi:putative tryptophan/tyrosine transport system substrate-binding protein
MYFLYKRRAFITLLGGAAAAWPLAARAQQLERMRRVGVLMPFAENDADAQANITAFREAFQTLGWTDSRNVRIDYRWGGGEAERISTYASELVGLKPDVILVSSPLVLQPLLQETRSIPIVFTQITDPVGSGFVASLAHPGGNVTGFAIAEFSMYGKSLEVLKEVAPQVARVAVLLNPEQAPQAGMWRAIEVAAPSFRVQVTAADVRDSAEIKRAIDSFASESNGGLIVLPNVPTIVHRGLIMTLTARHRLPAVYSFRQFVREGALISYGPDRLDQYRQAAAYVDRILRGEKPSDLPVQQPTKFELAINLKTAKALGLEVSPMLLGRADEVIE